ncbi:histidine phosphatase family protein [Brachybacterium aquaticum]|uniref:Putative phosphoglycerate mutase n=1 Tax=Brachybacterium aquaticum TaxID=1432564 RepID=A0A841AIK6_9MICO|nr:histidine phosphatase family protein [Brachybacterium aquaticum]MBB5832868.1 putative phosphoglycerate mutase [Brachybacterium aquaticum]
MRLLLLRHGQTPSNVGGILDAAYPGPGLTDLGHAQARAVPDALAGEDIAGIHVSRLLRTHETAAPLAAARGISPRLTEGIEEIRAGELQGRQDADAVRAYQGMHHRWSAGEFDDGVPGGESGQQFWDRWTAALRHISGLYAEGASVVVVSHGAAIRTFAAVAGGLGAASLAERPLFNTGLVTVVGSVESGWSVEDWEASPVGGEHLLSGTKHDVTADDRAEARA